jgi:hypothetical protein
MSKPRSEDEIVRSRQKSASRITAILLIGFVILTFAITIAKLTVNQ